ncbi:excisionase [Cupriavidus sp. CuC1]|uniref:excisionase n=1 Tax=Cupriavidus sp. CuC1 TaxID=3373131 RepID=UPI0037D0EDE6
MKLRLDKWLALNFDPPPAIRNAHLWIKAGKIYPPPVKVGRHYYVDPGAEYVDYSYTVDRKATRRLSLVERLNLEEESRQRARQAAIDQLPARKRGKK